MLKNWENFQGCGGGENVSKSEAHLIWECSLLQTCVILIRGGGLKPNIPFYFLITHLFSYKSVRAGGTSLEMTVHAARRV